MADRNGFQSAPLREGRRPDRRHFSRAKGFTSPLREGRQLLPAADDTGWQTEMGRNCLTATIPRDTVLPLCSVFGHLKNPEWLKVAGAIEPVR